MNTASGQRVAQVTGKQPSRFATDTPFANQTKFHVPVQDILRQYILPSAQNVTPHVCAVHT